MSEAWVYVLVCSDGTYYVGSTKDLVRRMKEHQGGYGCQYTSVRRPIQLLFAEQYPSLYTARAAERQIKNWSRKKKEALIAGDRTALHELSQCMNKSHYRNNPKKSES